jgi:hypothetical protein
MGPRPSEAPPSGRGRRAGAFIVSTVVLAVVVAVSVVALGGFLPRDGTPAATPGTAASLEPAATPRTTGSVPASPTPGLPARTAIAVVPEASASPAGPAIAPSPGASAAAASVTPRPTLPPRATPTAVASIAAPSSAPTRQPTAAPGDGTPAPTRRPLSTSTPGPITSVASPKAPPPTDFLCEGTTTFRDPLDRGWRLNGVYWAERSDFDRLTLRLVPDSAGDGRPARVTAEARPSSEVATELGLPEPEAGETAVLVRFSDAVALTRDLQGTPAKAAVKTFAATEGDDGRVWAVFGVEGAGCYSLQVPFWTDPALQTTPFVDVTLDVEH